MYRTVLIGVFVLGLAQSAIAQVGEPSAVKKSPAEKEWNGDLAGTVGLSAGLGAAKSRLDVSGAVTVVRTTRTADFGHRCLGVTAMASVASGERLFLVGPRWDVGTLEGIAFARAVAGVRNVSGALRNADAGRGSSDTQFAVGAGAGVGVLGVLLDVNWIVSPASDRSRHRLTVSLGYMWSFP
jgi:hypothetical protein